MRAPALGILVLLASLTAAAQPTVALRLHPPVDMDEELRSLWTATITNLTAAPIEDLGFYISSGSATFVVRPDICPGDEFPSTARCTIDLPAGASRELSFTTRNQDRFGHFSVVMEASAAGALLYDEAVFGRRFLVNTTADAGPGSLRQVIADMNASCEWSVPCVVDFGLAEGRTEHGLYSISVLSPLPEIIAPDVFVDGGSQIRRDNGALDRPLVILDGAAAGEANGLTFRNSSARVTNLSVSHFRGNGIETHAGHSMIMHNFLVQNGSRGVVVADGRGYVTDNVLGSNGRSGGFFWTTTWLKVLRNIVEDNGASGLFFHKATSSRDFVEAYDNVIRNNAHAGIGLSILATGDFARNSFGDNGGRAIDLGMDGPTTATVPGYAGRGGIIGAPNVVAAAYANGVTSITIRLAARLPFVSSFARVSVYAGKGNAQQLLATVGPRAEEFTVQIPRDLRGESVRAAMVANTIENWDDAMIATSEMGEARVVE